MPMLLGKSVVDQDAASTDPRFALCRRGLLSRQHTFPTASAQAVVVPSRPPWWQAPARQALHLMDPQTGTWAEHTVFWYRHQDDGHRPSNAAMSLWQDSSIDARQRRGAT